MSKKKPIQIIHKKLGRHRIGKNQVDGLASKEERIIEIDSRLRGKDHIETVIHEVQHCQNPKWPEIMVEGKAKELTEILWALGYRRVEL